MNTIHPFRVHHFAMLACAAALCVAGAPAAASTYQILHQFDGKHGANPLGALVIDSSGVLHGTTAERPPKGGGALFQIHTDGSRYEVDHYFVAGEDDGAMPVGDLAIDASDSLYGTLLAGGEHGALFIFDPIDGYRVDFIDAQRVGKDPRGGLTRAPDGTLYGTTSWGGGPPECRCGTVFEWDPATDAYTVLHTFAADEGAEPRSSLLLVGHTLYGTTVLYGPGQGGQPFSLDVDGTRFATYPPTDGNSFNGGLTPDASGNLWGLASGGGKKNGGGIYRIAPDGTYEWRAAFSKESFPNGDLLLGRDGRFYGNTRRGGKYGYGSIFSYDPVANVITRLFSFHPARDGISPIGGLVQDASGALYGETSNGGKWDGGVIFKFVP